VNGIAVNSCTIKVQEFAFGSCFLLRFRIYVRNSEREYEQRECHRVQCRSRVARFTRYGMTNKKAFHALRDDKRYFTMRAVAMRTWVVKSKHERSEFRISLLLTHYSLLITPYSLLITPYSLLITPYSLLLTPYSLLLTRHIILTLLLFASIISK
jgi:hypothetical protein